MMPKDREHGSSTRARHAIGALFCLAVAFNAAAAPLDTVDFSRDIRPILSSSCFNCHGHDPESRKGDLRLDEREDAFRDRDGYAVIVAGSIDDSLIIDRITEEDPEFRMPAGGDPLTPEQVDLFRAWIEQGAEWEEHWAFAPVVSPTAPTSSEDAWAESDIDRFILARLEAEGLGHAAVADKRTLIRRVTLDLTGLPPSPEDVAAFVADDSPDAYVSLVDRLLATDQYGEHMSRYWLDAARYADTHGLHLDNYREMWPYRDWVINAFNDNLPFDTFTVEQLAGDLLEDATPDQRIATGFNRAHVTTSEGGSIAEEYYVRYAVDRVNTTSTVWMGMTMGCAACHEHKYDPFTQREFYELFAYFNNITENAMDGNRKDSPPVVKVPTDDQATQLANYDAQIEDLNGQATADMPHVDATQAAWEATMPRWQTLTAVHATSTGGAAMDLLDDRSVLVSGANPATDVYEVTFPLHGAGHTAIRLEALEHSSLPSGRTGRAGNGNAVMTGFEAEIASADAPTEWAPIRLVRAWADYEQDSKFAVANALDGKTDTGWAAGSVNRDGGRQAIFLAAAPFGSEDGSLLRVRLKHESESAKHQFGRIRVKTTTAASVAAMSAAVSQDTWHSVGPFPAHTGSVAFHEAFAPEAGNFNAGQEFDAGDAKLKWEKQHEWRDGAFHALSGDVGASYVYRNLRSDTTQRVTLRVGADDAVKVWVNRVLALESDAASDRGVSAHELQVTLNAGNNQLLVKVVNHAGDSGYSFGLDSDPRIVPATLVDVAADVAAEREADQSLALSTFFRENVSDDPALREVVAERRVAQTLKSELDGQVATTLVMEEREEPRGAYVLNRGAYDDQGEQVQPGVPGIFPSLPDDAPSNRLALARWLVDPEHPLTARVTVNRLWQQVFGQGIVRTTEDFGSQGEPPTHPELLDWLASDFVANGWDIKAFMKQMVMSSTYRQSSTATADARARDSRNQLYSRGPRFRLDAEAIRDQALALGGLLQSTVGGPSVKPPQPAGLWKAVGYVGSNTDTFVSDIGPENVHRRSLYTFLKRTAPAPQMNILDAPSREACTVRRERTNTPMQALMLMNDPQYVDAARAFARRVLAEGGESAEERIAYAFEAATARPARAAETAILIATLQTHMGQMAEDAEGASQLALIGEVDPDAPVDVAELAAWTMMANLILNLDEVINKG
jgi:hypothetical protein